MALAKSTDLFYNFNTFRNIAGLEVVDYRMNLDAWLEFYSVIYGKQVKFCHVQCDVYVIILSQCGILYTILTADFNTDLSGLFV